MPGQLVPRIVEHPQQGHEVADVRRLEEAQAAVLDEGDVPATQLDLEQVTVVAGPGQHDLGPQVDPRLEMLEDHLGHRVGLGRLVAAGGEHRSPTGGHRGPQRLGEAVVEVGDDRVGQVEDRLGGAVVLLEGHRRRSGEVPGEVQEVAHRRRPEGVDGLGVVAHDGDPRIATAQSPDDVGLQDVGVLVLVDEHVVVGTGEQRTEGRVGDRGTPVEQQIVEVEQRGGPLALHVAVKARPDPVELVAAPGKGLAHDLVERGEGVDHA